MSLPDQRAAPEELFETFPEESPEEVMALADTEPAATTDGVETAAFDRFVDGVSVERTDRPGPADDENEVDLDELFG
ncbi:hypothetical protein [Haloarchaeobius litoreus]|uniref:Uncharacterized protein n=1 Tax=Haloarchaeobius litoreus TaxID=755306 RepID=A0ABD6DLR7_9EURY|nr:hypothetical protein [Haloarchaeobius litoreus]